MKPDWNLAPEWANYLAQDGDGAWWWYENRPKVSKFGPYWTEPRGKFELAAGATYNSWNNSLEVRP